MYLKQILSEYTTTTAQYIYSTNTKVKVKAGSLTMIWFSFQTEFIAATRLAHTPPTILYDLENIFKKVQIFQGQRKKNDQINNDHVYVQGYTSLSKKNS